MGHDHDLGKTKNPECFVSPRRTQEHSNIRNVMGSRICGLKHVPESSWNVDIDFLLGRDGRDKTREIKEETINLISDYMYVILIF